MARQVNELGVNLVKSSEACELNAYKDIRGRWTIGYGHTKDVREGMSINQEQAEALFREDLDAMASIVQSLTSSVPTSDNEFSAMVSLCFNIGPGPGGFENSSVLKYHLEKRLIPLHPGPQNVVAAEVSSC